MTVWMRPSDPRDGNEWVKLGDPVWITMRLVLPDGSLAAPAGACPECATLPLGTEPVICPHGVALPPARPQTHP